MYKYYSIDEQAKGAEQAAEKPVVRYGVNIYVDTDPDGCGSDFHIDPADEKGLQILRSFCRQMADHYKRLSEAQVNVNNESI